MRLVENKLKIFDFNFDYSKNENVNEWFYF